MKVAGKRRCLLIAGGVSSALNHPRYGHELRWWAWELASRGFECWLCLRAGLGPTLSSNTVTQTSACRQDVEAGLAWLRGIGDGDFGLLVASNHGSRSGLCLWGADFLTPSQLEAALQPAKGTRALVLGQCYAGIFGSLADQRTAVLTACGPDEPSWACASPPGLLYDEFVYQLGTALFGAPPDASQPGPAKGARTLEEAFLWARDQDRRPETPMIFDLGGMARTTRV